jgi:predicted metal-dependent phosphoesterase TrpH
MFKIDLHTHSFTSPDGSLKLSDYRKILEQGNLDFIAVTDHNTIDFAKTLFAELGSKIIVGEEISAKEGDLIGLYLTEVIPAGLSAAETAARIHSQGGLVYVPHPFEKVRKGLPAVVMYKIADRIDIVETHNGRALLPYKGKLAKVWAESHGKAIAASSDAHGPAGWGKTFSIVAEEPTRDNLLQILQAATFKTSMIGSRGILYPKLNRLRKKISRA